MIGSYARQSNEDASKYSISSQLDANREKAQKLFPNEPIKEYIDDGYSGEFLDRPAMTQLRQDVRDGVITKIICFDPDRLSRKLMNQLVISDEFERRGVEIIFVNGDYAKTPEGNLFYSMRGAISEFEKAKINERMSRGRREKAKEGKVVKDPKMYGYGYDKENGKLYIIEEEAQVVRLIFDLFTTPSSFCRGVNGIARYLTESGVPTKRNGKGWHRQVVRQILMNETYTGVYYQNKWNTEGMLGNKYRPDDEKVPMKQRPKEDWIGVECPVIIDEFQFQQAHRLLGESKRRSAKISKHQYLLSGLIRCGECGNTLTGRKSKNWSTYIFEYTDIKNTAGAKNKGCGLHIKCQEIDTYVWDAVYNWLNQPDEIAAAREEETSRFEETELQRIENRLNQISLERKRILQLFRSNMDIGEELIREEFAGLKKEEENLTKQKDELEKVMSSTKNVKNTRQILQEAVNYYLSLNPNELTFDHKQQLIRHVIQEIRIFRDGTVELHTF